MSIIRDNRVFFICFSMFAVVGAVLLQAVPQGEDILFFSARRHPVTDWFFRWGTRLGEGYAFLAAGVAFLILRRYATTLVIGLLGFVVAWVSYGTKTWFAHDRPWAWFGKFGQADAIIPVEGVPLLSGATSFPSGHTMAAFALYSFLAFAVSPKRWWPALFFLLALTVGVSRIYLGQHFLKDVYAGAVMGVVLGLAAYVLLAWWERRKRA